GLVVWDTATMQRTGTFPGMGGGYQIGLSSDGRLLACGSGILDVSGKEPKVLAEFPPGVCDCYVFAPDVPRLAAYAREGDERVVKVWDWADGKLTAKATLKAYNEEPIGRKLTSLRAGRRLSPGPKRVSASGTWGVPSRWRRRPSRAIVGQPCRRTAGRWPWRARRASSSGISPALRRGSQGRSRPPADLPSPSRRMVAPSWRSRSEERRVGKEGEAA